MWFWGTTQSSHSTFHNWSKSSFWTLKSAPYSVADSIFIIFVLCLVVGVLIECRRCSSPGEPVVARWTFGVFCGDNSATWYPNPSFYKHRHVIHGIRSDKPRLFHYWHPLSYNWPPIHYMQTCLDGMFAPLMLWRRYPPSMIISCIKLHK